MSITTATEKRQWEFNRICQFLRFHPEAKLSRVWKESIPEEDSWNIDGAMLQVLWKGLPVSIYQESSDKFSFAAVDPYTISNVESVTHFDLKQIRELELGDLEECARLALRVELLRRADSKDLALSSLDDLVEEFLPLDHTNVQRESELKILERLLDSYTRRYKKDSQYNS